MREAAIGQTAAAPATVTGEIAAPLAHAGKVGERWGKRPKIRKPGDLPTT